MAPAAQPAPSKDDDDDDGFFSTKNQLKWMGIAAVVGVGVYLFITSQPSVTGAPVETRSIPGQSSPEAQRCESRCSMLYGTSSENYAETGSMDEAYLDLLASCVAGCR